MYEFDENYPKDTLHMYADNKHALKTIDTVLNHLTGELYTIEAYGKMSDNCR